MIRTIKQRIYIVGLLPLATLAVALVVFNGVSRINEANQALGNARNVTAALLESPAVDALVVGNVSQFEQAVSAVLESSPWLICVTLRDVSHRVISQTDGCDGAQSRIQYSPIRAPSDMLSDLTASGGARSVRGELGLLMNDESVVIKRRQVIVQLAASLVMIALVLVFIWWLLRARLIEPIGRIGNAMQSLSQHDYNARVPVVGDDELTRLAEAINDTIRTIAAYTRELELRRSDADRALHDADEARLEQVGLVRSLTEALEGPMRRTHAKLTAAAIANQDPAVKDLIKQGLAEFQQARADFADLIELATIMQQRRQSPSRDLADIISDIERDVRLFAETAHVPIHFVITQLPWPQARGGEPTGIVLDVDGVRLKKALIYLIRAMSRRCTQAGVYVSAELIKVSADTLHISLHLRAFYEPISAQPEMQWIEKLNQYGNKPPALVGWSEPEIKAIEYLLRTIGLAPTFGASPAGAVNVLLAGSCHYTVEPTERSMSAEWITVTRPVSTTLVSNDRSLMRFTTRGDLSHQEIKLSSFPYALANSVDLRAQDVLIVDISEDMAEAVSLLDTLKEEGSALPQLIAICPPGRISESLGNRLLELGFTGTIQKPLHYSRLIEVIRTELSQPLKWIARNMRRDH